MKKLIISISISISILLASFQYVSEGGLVDDVKTLFGHNIIKTVNIKLTEIYTMQGSLYLTCFKLRNRTILLSEELGRHNEYYITRMDFEAYRKYKSLEKIEFIDFCNEHSNCSHELLYRHRYKIYFYQTFDKIHMRKARFKDMPFWVFESYDRNYIANMSTCL